MPHYDRAEDLPPRYRAQVEAEDRARAEAREDRRRTIGELTSAVAEVEQTLTDQVREATGRDDLVVTYGGFEDGVECSLDGHGGWRVTLPLRAWGVNEERSGGWWNHRPRTKDARDFTRLALADQNLPHFEERVEIEARCYGTKVDPGSDLPLVKACVDGLRDLGVLTDDSGRYVARLILNAPLAGGVPRIVLEVRPYTPPTV